jgi:DNA topoisomerase-3
MPKVDTGKIGQIAGECPLCKRNVIRGKYNYGCMGYSDGCTFKMGITMCKRDIPISEVSRLLATGTTAFLSDFVSKNGK